MSDRIKQRRKIMGLTQEQLGEKLGVKKSAVAKYENGRVENIKRSVIAEMAKVLDCSPCYLMGWDDDKSLNTEDIPKILAYYNQLNDIGKHEAEKRVEELTYIPQYNFEIKAAHNEYESDPDEQEKMREDLHNLKRPK